MDKRNLENRDLDRVGRRLLEAARVPEAEIERIAAAPGLFDAVKARVKHEQAGRRGRRRWAGIFLGGWADFSFPRRQAAAAAFAVVTILLAAVLGVMVFRQPGSTVSQNANEAAPPRSNFQAGAPVDNIEPAPDAGTPPGATERQILNAKDQKPAGRNASKRAWAADSSKPTRKKIPAKRRNRPAVKEEETFMPVGFAANLVEEELHVYRVELPAASLASLGINLPEGDGNARIKTDLLVGADGVTRGVRLVK